MTIQEAIAALNQLMLRANDLINQISAARGRHIRFFDAFASLDSKVQYNQILTNFHYIKNDPMLISALSRAEANNEYQSVFNGLTGCLNETSALLSAASAPKYDYPSYNIPEPQTSLKPASVPKYDYPSYRP